MQRDLIVDEEKTPEDSFNNSLPEEVVVEETDDKYRINLANRSFIPKERNGLREASKSLSDADSDLGVIHGLIQFKEPLTREDHTELLEDNIKLLEYLGGTTYLASVPLDSELILQPLSDESNIAQLTRFTAPLLLEDKIESELYQDLRTLDGEDKLIKVLVKFYNDIDVSYVESKFKEMGIELFIYVGNNSYEIEAKESLIEEVALLNGVQAIEFGLTPFQPINDGAREDSHTDTVQQIKVNGETIAYDGLTGKGIRIGIADTGVDDNHKDFRVLNDDGSLGASRVNPSRTDNNADGHGTHVASIAAGNGFNSNSIDLRGHAPNAEIGAYGQLGNLVMLYHRTIVDNHTHVTNHSYVHTSKGYRQEAASLDKIIRGDEIASGKNVPIPSLPQVWAAGNNGLRSKYGRREGYYSLLSPAKNSISVGSIDTRDGRLSDLSSLGPTLDGRIKPDLVAPGCNDSIAGKGIQAAKRGSQSYTNLCGTSMAAPVVTGIIALMMEAYIDTFGLENGSWAPPIAPSTYKAILIHTATDLVKTEAYKDREFENPDTGEAVIYYEGPDFATGWGLVNADSATKVITKETLWEEGEISFQEDDNAQCLDFKVLAGESEVKVTIAWDDEAGSVTTPVTDSKLVNDLNLELISPDGTVIFPWTLTALPVAEDPTSGDLDPIKTQHIQKAVRGVDHNNNVEMVSSADPSEGQWQARISGLSSSFLTLNNNIQKYSIVGSHSLIKTSCQQEIPPKNSSTTEEERSEPVKFQLLSPKPPATLLVDSDSVTATLHYTITEAGTINVMPLDSHKYQVGNFGWQAYNINTKQISTDKIGTPIEIGVNSGSGVIELQFKAIGEVADISFLRLRLLRKNNEDFVIDVPIQYSFSFEPTNNVKAIDLIVELREIDSGVAGEDISPNLEILASNIGGVTANGTESDTESYMVDLILSTDTFVPKGYASYSPNFSEDVLLRGGRISNTPDLLAGMSQAVSEGSYTLPADTPTGNYFLCAHIDPGARVAESDETNNTDCITLTIK